MELMQKDEKKNWGRKKVSYKCNRLALTFFTLSLYWCALCYPYLTDNPLFSHTQYDKCTSQSISILTHTHAWICHMCICVSLFPFADLNVYDKSRLLRHFLLLLLPVHALHFFFLFLSRYRGIDILWNNGWSLICSNQCISWTLTEMHESYVWDMNDGLIWIHGEQCY